MGDEEQGRPSPGHPCERFALRQSGGPGHKNKGDFGSMTLRRQVSLVLPFGSRSVVTINLRWF